MHGYKRHLQPTPILLKRSKNRSPEGRLLKGNFGLTAHRDNPETLADALAAAAVEPLFEAVVASEGGINPQSARAFVILERLGQKRRSILADSLDD
jgi:hypothetical protein